MIRSEPGYGVLINRIGFTPRLCCGVRIDEAGGHVHQVSDQHDVLVIHRPDIAVRRHIILVPEGGKIPVHRIQQIDVSVLRQRHHCRGGYRLRHGIEPVDAVSGNFLPGSQIGIAGLGIQLLFVILHKTEAAACQLPALQRAVNAALDGFLDFFVHFESPLFINKCLLFYSTISCVCEYGIERLH